MHNLSLTALLPSLSHRPQKSVLIHPLKWQAGLWGGVLSIIALTTMTLCHVAPSSAQSNRFSDEQVRRYAAAARDIENKRQEILIRAKSDPGWSEVASRADGQGKRVCDLSRKPRFLDKLCGELYSFSQQTIANQGFSARDFNAITNALKSDAQLRRRIQQAL